MVKNGTTIADWVKHVVAVRRTNVVVDAISAGTGVVVAIPRSNPSRFTTENRNQVISVSLSDVGKAAALFGAVSDSLVMGHRVVTNSETSHGVSSEKSESDANNCSFERHLFTVACAGA